MPLILGDNWPPDVASLVCSFCAADLTRGEPFIGRTLGGARVALHPVCAGQLAFELAGDCREAVLAYGGPEWAKRAAMLARPGLLLAEGVVEGT